ncbi:MAG: NAD(P)H-dependent oxidoreductase [Bacteroidia bacterium]|nr:NAD(P)H-dependent oxidoreductase [Bacteroidia bacterium]
MSGICIISATQRPLSKTLKIAENYEQLLKELNVECRIFSLEKLPENFLNTEMHGKRSPGFQEIIDSEIAAFEKFIIVSPEYNGSFPGVFKVFLDALSPRYWTDKKAALAGVSDGRAGNLRGMEHLTNILNYLKVNVYHNKIPISMVSKLLDENGKLNSPETIELLRKQLDGFLKF